MRIGGGGREQWMIIVPVAGLVVLTTVLLGGPEEALNVLEHTLYVAWDAASVFFRR